MLSPLALALIGWQWVRTRSQRARTTGPGAGAASDALAFAALAGALWTAVAADLVSLLSGTALFLVGTAGLVWQGAGPAQGGRRLLLATAAGTGLLACVLIVGKVNGHFWLSQLSTSGFTSAAFFGLALAAAAAAPIPPFHGWVLRLSRHRLTPALATGGAGVALVLLLAAFRTTGEEFSAGWQRWLAAAGWLAALVGSAVAIGRRPPAIRLAALVAGKAGLACLAASVGTPASMAAALLYSTVALPVLALLWLIALAPVRPRPAARPEGRRPLAETVRPELAALGLLVATAAGLPGTVGGVSLKALAGALSAWPAGDQLLRVPLVLLEAVTLAAGASLILRRQNATPVPRRLAWAGLLVAAVAVVGPVAAPQRVIGDWFGPIAAQAAGTGTAPLALDLSRVPTLPSALLGAVALWALVQRRRGKEWLPVLVRALLGAVALVWIGAATAWRRRGLASAPAAVAEGVWHRIEAAAETLMAAVRPLEERYYAAAAVMAAVALFYIIGR
jgi:multicomponent Na+:H+ antiporter subunit A